MPIQKKLKKKTPEEIKAKEEEQRNIPGGTEYIKEREKRAQELFLAGEPLKRAQQKAGESLRAGEDIKVAEEAAKAEAKRKEVGLAGLQPQQVAELEALRQEDLEKIGVPEPEIKEGIAGVNIPETLAGTAATLATIPGVGLIGSLAVGGAGLAIGAIPGAAITLGKIGVFGKGVLAAVGIGSVGTIRGLLTSGRISELEGDITELRTSTRDTVTDVTKGADVGEAIDTLVGMEEEIRTMAANLNLAVRNDPISKLKAKGTQEFLYRNLNAVMRRRQALERYAIDGDVISLARNTGEGLAE